MLVMSRLRCKWNMVQNWYFNTTAIYFCTEVEWMLIPFCAFTSISLFPSFISVMPFFLSQTSRVIAHVVPSMYLLKFASFFFYMDSFSATCNFDFTVHHSHIIMQLINCPTIIHQWGKVSSWWLIHRHQGSTFAACLGLVETLFCVKKTFEEQSHILPT